MTKHARWKRRRHGRVWWQVALSFAMYVCISLPAQAANYTSCFNWRILTTDSNVPIASGPNTGMVEDYYVNPCNVAPNGCVVTARGVRFKVSKGTWSRTIDTSPAGCGSWAHADTSGFTITVYGYAQHSPLDNFVRIHDDPNDFSAYPGATYSILLANVSPTASGTDVYTVGGADSKWTAMAAASFTLYRVDAGLEKKEFHLGIDETQCGGASAHYGSSNSAITSGRHFLRVGNNAVGGCPSPAPQSRQKFVVAHEMGHAILALHYGDQPGAVNGGEPAVSVSNNTGPNACTPTTSYDHGTKEFNSLAFREGFAHFVAARAWNDPSATGAFRWEAAFAANLPSNSGPVTIDLELWGPSTEGNGNNATGGRLKNFCCVGACAASWAGAANNEDWLRFLWDWHTATNYCVLPPSMLGAMEVYSRTRLNGGLANANYYEKAEDAMEFVYGVGDCARSAWYDLANSNGVAN